MSIKKLGTMSDPLSLGLRRKVEELTELVTNFEAWITSLEDVERPGILDELIARIAYPLGSTLESLQVFEKGEEYYSDLDGATFTKERAEDCKNEDLEDVLDQWQREKITKTQVIQTLRKIVEYENLRIENEYRLLNAGLIKETSA